MSPPTRRPLGPVVALVTVCATLAACGGVTFSPGDAADGGHSGGSSGSGSSGGSSGSSSGSSGSGSSSGSSSGGSSSGGSGSGSSSGSSGSGSSSGSSSGGLSGEVPTNHRTGDAQCSTPAPAGTCSEGGSGPPGSCNGDSGCTDGGVDGRCVQNGPLPGCTCTYDTCMHDTDCPTGETCACHGSPDVGQLGNSCVPGNCRIDSDCGAGGYCSPSVASDSCGRIGGYYCHTPKDTCVNDTDCPVANDGPQICTYSTTDKHWACTPNVVCA